MQKFLKPNLTGWVYSMHIKIRSMNSLGKFILWKIIYDLKRKFSFSYFQFFNFILFMLDYRMQPARLSIFFKEHQFITSRRSELYGQTDFLANCGGLLGLFMGVSALSIIEVIYYFTLRLGCTLRLRRSRKRKSSRNQKNSVAPAEKNIPNIMIVSAVDEKKD